MSLLYALRGIIYSHETHNISSVLLTPPCNDSTAGQVSKQSVIANVVKCLHISGQIEFWESLNPSRIGYLEDIKWLLI